MLHFIVFFFFFLRPLLLLTSCSCRVFCGKHSFWSTVRISMMGMVEYLVALASEPN